MKNRYSFFIVAFVIAIIKANTVSAQMVGDNIFLPGHFVEVGIAPNGSLGSTRNVPGGYYPYSPTFSLWDPALAGYATVANPLMMVYDAGHDGWTVGTPPFFGDYSMPGTPYEGWGVQVNGTHSEAQFQYYESGYQYSGGTLTGAPVSYTNSGGHMIGVWNGSAVSGALQITQTTELDTNASWVIMTVKLVNTGGTSLTNVYYERETDPDNDEARGGSFTTRNVIDYQNDRAHRVQVTAWGTKYTTQSLSLCTKDCRAVCYIQSGWPMSTGTSLASIWAGSGVTVSGTNTGDYSIGLVWNLGTIAAGDSTNVTYAYVFNGTYGLDSALSNPQLVTLGIAHDSTDTVTSCAFSGDTLYASIINATTGNWAGSTWTWAPATSLTATTGLSSGVIMSGITGITTYTITGVDPSFGSCDSMTFFLTVSPSAGPSPPTVRDTSYCVGAIAVPLTAVGSGLLWYTVPTGGVGSSTAPTPSTAIAGTITYYVSQTIAGCESTRVAIHVTIIPLPGVINGIKGVCVGLTTVLSDTTSGGTWSSGNTLVATIGSGTGIVTGVKAGTVTIFYSVSSGCSTSVVVTVNPLPAAIGGVTTVCSGTTTALSDGVGGTWSSANTAVATIGTSGVVTGVSPGTSTITYTLPTGCIITTTVTVRFTPTAILGKPYVCIGLTTVLSDATLGGLWSSTDTTVAKIGATTGVATGIAATIVTISYTLAGCAATTTFTVNPLPLAIGGTPNVCAGQTTILYNIGGGTWSSSNTSVATVGSTGTVTGISAGSATVTYTLPTGCDTTIPVTVYANPSGITGIRSVCVGSTTALSDTASGGHWTSGNLSVASVGFSTGVVSGVSAGVDTITYTMGSGCFTTITVTVNPLPGFITGATSICTGTTTSLSDLSVGGTWSSGNTLIAIVGSSTGIVTGESTGSVFITYTLPTGCLATVAVAVHAPPVGITGITTVCAGATTTLSDGTGGGTWSSSNTSVATVTLGSGIVTGVTNGTATITYKVFSTGCIATTTVTVSPAPGIISGITGICVGATTTLSDGVTGGSWTSSNTTVATVGFTTGVVTGIKIGTATITYSLGGTCKSTITVTVTSGPPAIGGIAGVCVGSTTTLSDGTGGGVWSSSNTAVATITGGGVVTGISAGTATISYSVGVGCTVTRTVTVNPLPSAITGTANICIGATTALTDTTGSGTWSSSNTAVAAVGVSTGIVTGLAAGTATITYTLAGTGCTATMAVTVNAGPTGITGTATLCAGTTTALTDITTGGTWSSSNTAVATVSGTGIVNGITGGTATITYTPATGCAVTKTVTVNPLPGSITGPSAVCVGATITLTDGGGGTWSSSNTAVATIGAGSGIVSGIALGTATITYTLPTGCIITTVISVSPSPGAILGASSVCAGSAITLSDGVGGGTWISSNTAVATAGFTTGIVSGVSGGTATITYSLGSGCTVTKTITVNPSPTAITGTTTLCIGATSLLSDGTTGGTWSSSNSGVATISTGGLVTGLSAGTTTITYILGGGCFMTTAVTVSPSPVAISGTTTVCIGNTATLSDAVGGGTWTSDNSAVATIGFTTGIVTGVSAGTAVITYSLGGVCVVTTTVTVSAGPSGITGTTILCAGTTTALTDITTGGAWSSSNSSVATVSGTGIVSGISAGTATITYTLGCITTRTVTVTAAPGIIGGPAAVCQGSTITLSDGTGGGTWAIAPLTVATIGSGTGVVSGISAGTAIVTYSVGSCTVNKTITVNPITGILGSGSLCTGLTTSLTDLTAGGTWSSSNTSVASVSGGTVTGTGVGTATITYTILTTGCFATKVITVNSIPVGITGTAQVCKGSTTTLSDATTGGTWTTLSTTVSVGIGSGVVTGVSVGTGTITYSLGSGCTVTTPVTVNPLPSLISGSSDVCLGSSTTLSDGGGGTWSTTSANITIGSLSGVVTGIALPSALVTYTLPTGCMTTKLISVDALPGAISGPATVCQTQTITLTDAGAGTWTSSALPVATVGLSSGIVSGITPGTATITYTIPGGCYALATVTVIASPTSITGAGNVCAGGTILLSDGSTGGTWTSADPGIATIGGGTGVVSGIASGTVLIYYTVGSGCTVFTSVIVNPSSPITGSTTVCQRQTIVLTDTTLGGVWSSSNTSIATVTPLTGIVTGVNAGPVTINYLLSTGCLQTYAINVLAAPKPITGTATVCVGQVTALHDLTLLGTWSSDFPGIGSVDAFGFVTGVSAGTTPISYTAGGCPATVTVTVYPIPATISGSSSVCIGQTTLLTDGGGGHWSSSNTAAATIGITSGLVSGITAGTSTIVYTLSTGCTNSIVMTVNPLPGPITGVTQVCVGMKTTLSDTSSGGIWSSPDATVSVNPATGDVSGITAGTATVYYTTGSGCYSSVLVTVNPIPGPISGASQVCVGQSVLYTDIGGGTWSSYNPTLATVDSATGVVTGISSGITFITYTLGTGCNTQQTLTINPVPAPITGNTNLCVGTMTTLGETTGSGTWTSSVPTVATTDAFGDISGIRVGTTIISYTLATGCAAATVVTVHPFPTPISGTANVCIGSTDLFTDGVSGGLWSSYNNFIATVGSASGLVNGVSLGADTIYYTITTGCAVKKPINVVPLPTAYLVTGGGAYCAGGAGYHIGLNGSATGINYFLYVAGVVATGPVAGTGSALDFGLQTVAGAYTVLAVNTGTGCSANMTGTATIIVNPSVKPSVDIFTAGGDTVCSGVLATFTAVPTNGGKTPAYQWNINGTNVGLSNTYSYVPANGDVVTLTMTSSASCAMPAEVSKTIKMTVSLPQMPTAAITADPGDTVCQGFPVKLTAVLEYGGSTPLITWMKNTVKVGTGATFSYLPVNGDIIYCTVTSSYPCVVTPTVNSPVIVMTVDTPVIPHVVIVASPGPNIAPGWSDTLTAIATNTGVSGATYQWLVDGMPIKGATGPTFISSTFKNGDTVSVLVTSSGMCEMTTHNWMYINVSDEAVKGITAGMGDITVLPNPNKGAFTVKGSLGTNNDEELTLELTDLLGQVVYNHKVIAKGGNINEQVILSHSLANGMYLLNLRSAAGSKVFHVVVEQ